MCKIKSIISSVCVIFMLLSFASCQKADTGYGVKENNKSEPETVTESNPYAAEPIMSSDREMSKYFDISLFDEENYADIYLGKKFKIDSVFADDKFELPMKIADLRKLGWDFAEGNTYDDKSLIFSYETIESYFVKNDVRIKGWFYNSSRSSKQLDECYIVKLRLENDFYKNPQNYHAFTINGITNSMAITDIIDNLGTPSHFYKVSDESYYLDYFITKKDRRNRITVYINPVEDSISAVEFSSYK